MVRNILALLLLAASAHADENALLDRWIAAAGGRQRLESVAAVHRVDAIDEDGMPGVREEWTTAALQRRERLAHERDEAITVYDGTNGWRRDWNGFVENLAGSDLRTQSDLAMIHSFAALTGVAGAPSIIDENTLEFHAKSGSAVRFVLDHETALPLRAEMPSFDGIRTVAFSDWRKVDGVAIAFGETWTTGPNKTTAHLQSIEFVPRDRVDLTKPSPGPEDAFYLRNGARSETLPFNFDNNHIMVLTTVNGAGPIWFLVDTGANYSIINQSRVSEFHLTPYGGLTTIGGGSAATSGSYVDHVTYRLGEVELRDQHAAVLELRGLEKLYGMQLGGLLGYDFLSRFVTDIDYVAKTLTLRPRTFDTSRISGGRVPLVMQGEQPYFDGSIVVKGETIPAWFILDVGAADTVTFTTPFIAEHHLLEGAGDAERTVHKFSAPDVEAFNPTNIRGLMDAIVIDGVTLPHVLVNLSAAKSGAYTSPAFSGNIGETILSRFAHVILDYGRNVMILQPQPSTTNPFEERKTFGMTIIAGSPDLHHFTISAVGADSPSAVAGFQKGDVITAIDGAPAETWNLAGIRKVFTSEGTAHDVAIMRGTQEVKIHTTIAMTPVSGLR
ncbi:MAG TPA: aspartyl protease family protein [Thermoanaerobaculia bacterium]|nr:aspartyl protease family protein [Thermoanaerobaculia bacterium]